MHEADVLVERRLKVDVVIPTLNESVLLDRCLSSVEQQTMPFEIVVCDGRSDDETLEIASDRAIVISSERGRARQMNCGADATDGDCIVFLHADTVLPAGSLDAVRDTFSDPGIVGGCFRLHFDEDNPLLRFYSWGTSVLKWKRLVFGDRAIFVRRSVFRRIGGFPEQPLFEDLELWSAMSREGRLAYLREGVITAARRFARYGYLRQQLRNFVLWLLYQFGVPVSRLVRFYPDRRTG